MADHAAHAHDDHGHGDQAHHGDYVKIWAILLGLLVVSVAGPFLGIPVITLLTAFGIAIVKAYMVVKHFMHIDVAAKYVAYFIMIALAFVFLLFAGAAPDVMKAKGRNWEKPSWLVPTAHAPKLPTEHGDDH